jgi:beta-phosphoglucomutase-like phosphatase (HAD superfamily)
MFDIDGTLVDSFAFDEQCFTSAVKQTLGDDVDSRWETYQHVTDRGLLMELLEKSNRSSEIGVIEPIVKARFVQNVVRHLDETKVGATAGAIELIAELKQRDDVILSIATGGWLESALIKLRSAGIDIKGIPIATSNDHHMRTEIMRVAQAKSNSGQQVVYFGDAEWDKKACAELGFKFVLLGNRTNHELQIADFSDRSKLSELLEIKV